MFYVCHRSTRASWRYIQGRMGGRKDVNYKRKEILIFKGDSFDGGVNIYNNICQYIRLHAAMHMRCDENIRFSAQVSNCKIPLLAFTFFCAQPLGKNNMFLIIQAACIFNGVRGTGHNKGILTSMLQ